MISGGYLYIITNSAWPNFIKIGITTDLDKRLQQYQTGSPHRDYRIVYSLYHPEYDVAEKKLKETMLPFAKSIKHEWYEVDFTMARDRILEQLEEYENS